ncbi:hypothetical protein Tco_1246500 [Tanacetum coccineum]
MNPRVFLSGKPTGRIFSNVHLRWIPTGKLLNSCTGKVDSEPAHGSIVDIPHIHACKQTLGLSAGTSFNGQKQQRIDLNADALYNEKQENLRVWLLKLLISKKPVPECHKVVRLGINPMIQPEPEDLPKDNPKLEIAVLRRRDERSLNNNSFLGEYECSSLALDREERRDEKKRLDHLKQDQTMLVIKRFSERKKVFRERKKTGKIRAKRRDDFRVEVDVRVLEEEVVPKVDDVSLVDGVFDGAFGGEGEEDVVMG